ncbi:hypothetical protein Nepgr_006081 [Nepenthes gracilis]|uniref:Uncharacterized protein n=1 Tax=Nepenthes gracilis TaxID=150966 RepID=A0AAD3XH15_NEPGR|nr:hypothetical protein Nepgr_006081 [Nepenthes gracilis]
MQPMMGKRLVLFPLPLEGHLNPMFQLAGILHSMGFSISIVHTHFNAPNPNEHTDFTFHPISDGLLENGASTVASVGLISTLNVKCVVPFRDCLSHMLLSGASDQGDPIACLITDAAWHFTQVIADGLKLPRIVLRTSNMSSFVVYAALPLLREKGYLPVRDPQSEEPVPELPPLKVKDIPRFKTADSEVFYNLNSRLCEETKASRGIIFNSFEKLEESEKAIIQREFGVPVFPIGPFHRCSQASSSSLLTPDQSCISWLNQQAPKSVLYVSFGSLAMFDEAEFLEIAWGLANSKQPFLWAVRPGLVHGFVGSYPMPDELMDAVAGRAHIVEWAPQQKVLRHPATGGFWTHSGWNSTLESICEGVPMICLPCFGDQLVNARYVSDVWKIGLRFENNPTRGEIEKKIKALMTEREAGAARVILSFLGHWGDLVSLVWEQLGASQLKQQELFLGLLLFPTHPWGLLARTKGDVLT